MRPDVCLTFYNPARLDGSWISHDVSIVLAPYAAAARLTHGGTRVSSIVGLVEV
jgi:hypothetical protein